MPLDERISGHLRQVLDILHTCDGLLLPGNKYDVPPMAYGAESIHPQTLKRLPKDINDVRFETEMAMIKYALKHEWPVVGICGGLQLANTALGGGLVQHLPQDKRVKVGGLKHVDTHIRKIGKLNQGRWEKHFEQHILSGTPANIYAATHPMRVAKGSLLGGVYRKQGLSNLESIGELSIHHQGCFEENLGRNLRAVAWAPDGVVEAIEMKDYPNFFLLTQFHFECNVSGIALSVIENLVNAAKVENAP